MQNGSPGHQRRRFFWCTPCTRASRIHQTRRHTGVFCIWCICACRRTPSTVYRDTEHGSFCNILQTHVYKTKYFHREIIYKYESNVEAPVYCNSVRSNRLRQDGLYIQVYKRGDKYDQPSTRKNSLLLWRISAHF